MRRSVSKIQWGLGRISLLAVSLTLGVWANAGEQLSSPIQDEHLIAYWPFDAATGMGYDDASGNGWDVRSREKLSKVRTRGVFGHALTLRDKHSLRVRMGAAPDAFPAITLSVWVRPTLLSGYRELFRQEGKNRFLFSFQSGGNILSFGTTVDGYEECDASIVPERAMDGRWHHCAATFDGHVARVYFDGEEVGSLNRAGMLSLSPGTPAFVGSSGGHSEHFQGDMDDFRIYKVALDPKSIKALHEEGVASTLALNSEEDREFRSFYVAGSCFAETLGGSRRNLFEKGLRYNRRLSDVLVARLVDRFPEEYHRFTAWTGMTPIQYLSSRDAALDAKLGSRLLEMMAEYKPLTADQIGILTVGERKRWQEVDALVEQAQSLGHGDKAFQDAPAWIRLVFECGSRIEWRPSVQEAVAPYRTPSTPTTAALTAKEARRALEQDWLHQADGKPSNRRIRDEIRWSRQLADRIEAAYPGEADLEEERSALAELAAVAKRQKRANSNLYFRVREVKRRIAFKNPAVDFDRVLFVDMPFPDGSEWPHETRHRLGYMAVPGGRLLILDGLDPGGKLTQLMPRAPLHGSFWRPDLSFDGTKVLFCFKPHNEKSFHLYEINTDGTGLIQLTSGPYDDLDPVYLPDGHILFSTTRGHTYVRCMPPTNAYPLARCDRDGQNIYFLSRSNEPEYLASVMNDGRVVYTRWEYTDKPLWRAQSLWTMHPDGTQPNTLWGNQSVWPDLLKDARSIPGSHRVMFTGSAHHNWFAGSVGIIDPTQGLNFPNGVTKITADVEWPESGNGPVDPIESPDYHASGHYEAYYSPYPLSETDFIVSANRNGKFVLYLMDVDGNRELIYEGVHNIFHALPVKARPRPRIIEDQVAWPTQEERLNPQGGVIFSNNVYQGAPAVLRGKAKYLRILNIEHKTYTYWHKRPYLSTGPVVSGVQSEGVKRILGTVPIERDGSVAFRAPSGIPLHFQLLDENFRALQTMRSFTGVMPGERRGCLGCHERHSGAPAPPSTATPIALRAEPREIVPPPWGEDSVSYARYVRPVLDKHCGSCHQGEGEAREVVDFTPRPGHLGFDETYWLLTGKPAWGTPYQMPENPPPGFGIAGMLMVEGYDQRDPEAYATPEPLTKLSYRSRLVEIASSGKHHGVVADPNDVRRLILWVDAMCPYMGTEEVRSIPDPEFQGIDWLAIRPEIENAPRIIRPGPLDGQG